LGNFKRAFDARAQRAGNIRATRHSPACPMNQPSTPSFAFAGTLTLEEFGRVQKTILPVWTRWYVTTPLQAIVLFCVTGLPKEPSTWLYDLGALAVVLIAVQLTIRRARMRTWKQSVQIVGRVHGAITPDGIDWVTDRSTSRYEWAKIIAVKQADGLTLAFYAPRCAFYFPRSFFDSDETWAGFNLAIAAYVAK
jgi:hypothetical protein